MIIYDGDVTDDWRLPQFKLKRLHETESSHAPLLYNGCIYVHASNSIPSHANNNKIFVDLTN